MDANSTVLVVAFSDQPWAKLVDSLTSSHGYRVLCAHSFEDANSILGSVHVDLVVGEEVTPEQEGCRDLLERCHWNQSRAAVELGLSRVGLANEIRRRCAVASAGGAVGGILTGGKETATSWPGCSVPSTGRFGVAAGTVVLALVR